MRRNLQMLRRAKKHQKKLAKLVLAALLFTWAVHGLMSPSVAEAADLLTVTGYSNGTFTPADMENAVITVRQRIILAIHLMK